MALDPSGNIYISGSTEFSDFPTTSGAFMPSTTTLITPFVSKISPDQGKLIYSTFVNGTAKGMGEGIAVNSAGQAFLIGMSWSEDFPTTPGAYGTGRSGVGLHKQTQRRRIVAAAIHTSSWRWRLALRDRH